MADDAPVTAHVEETGESAFSVRIGISGYSILGDEPLASGGGGLGPNPYDLLTAALGECTAMTVRWYAKAKEWPLDKVEVYVTHRKDEVPTLPGGDKAVKIDKFDKKIILHGDGLSETQRRKLVEIAAKCPVQRTLESHIVIQTLNANDEIM